MKTLSSEAQEAATASDEIPVLDLQEAEKVTYTPHRKSKDTPPQPTVIEKRKQSHFYDRIVVVDHLNRVFDARTGFGLGEARGNLTRAVL